jgi:hypothetical protein
VKVILEVEETEDGLQWSEDGIPLCDTEREHAARALLERTRQRAEVLATHYFGEEEGP